MRGLIRSTFCLLIVVLFEISSFSLAFLVDPPWDIAPEKYSNNGSEKGKDPWWSSMKTATQKDLVHVMLTSESPSRHADDYVPRLISLSDPYNSNNQKGGDSFDSDHIVLRNSTRESFPKNELKNIENKATRKRSERDPIRKISRFGWMRNLFS